jgi:hypothetical protein
MSARLSRWVLGLFLACFVMTLVLAHAILG